MPPQPENPPIGIALAAYQPEIGVFAEQLASLQGQTYPYWFCVIQLDSPLAPLRAEPRLEPYFADERFVWRENPGRLGHKKNFEAAIQATLARAPRWIACCDQDDVWYPQKLAREAAELAKLPPLALVHCDMHELKANASSRTVWQIERRGVQNARPEHLLVRNVVAGCAMLMDAELARRFPVIPEAFEYHDHWYAVVAACLGGVHAIREPLFAYRQHGGNVVGVTEFPGLTAPPPGHARWTPALFASKCRATWLKSLERAQAAMQAGLDLPPAAQALFGGATSLRLLGMAASNLRADPALARAAIARAFGKLLT